MMMGFFSSYIGFCYNEWFALPIEAFESCYVTKSPKTGKPLSNTIREWIPSQGTKPIKG